ncbi:hypothetical protein E2C01_083717 [Portunus trituberculatus]|uniref:Uncharacterized protein n=1 Tax=Portunus trituberculatus TaxID=210409 RepID=A0A5B7J4D0_PORTR|nr:hypothetical protein [Portunus trituberculatus]
MCLQLRHDGVFVVLQDLGFMLVWPRLHIYT